MLHELVPFIANEGYDIDLTDLRSPIVLVEERVKSDHFSKFGKYLRDYQVNSVNKLLEEGSGFLIGGTGYGKTIVCAAMSDILFRNGFRTIVIVPSGDLVSQTYDTFVACGLNAGRYSR